LRPFPSAAPQRRFRRAALVVAVALAIAGRGSAQPAEQPSPQLAAFERARERFAANDHAAVVGILVPFAGAKDVAPPLRTLLAASYLELGKAAEAAAVLAPVAASDQAGPPLLYQAARAASALGREDEAQGYLARASAMDPSSLAARTLGLHRAAAGDMRGACALLQPYVAAHAADADARIGAAFCSIELDQQAAAEALLRELPADEPRARVMRARLALLRGQPYEAIAQLEPIAKAPPPEIAYELRRNLAEAWIEVGKAQAAADLLARHAGGDPQLALLLARARAQAGDPEGVIAAVAPFVAQLTTVEPPAPALRPMLAQLALHWGRALLDRQRFGDAVPALTAATRLAPEDAPSWQALVQALRGAGRREEAEAALARLRAVAGKG